MESLQYWADRLEAHLSWMRTIFARPYERKDSNISFMKIMDSCLVNSRVLKDCRLSSVVWSVSSN